MDQFLGARPESFVYVLVKQIQHHWQVPERLRVLRTHLLSLRPKHQSRAAQRQFCVDRFTIWTIRDGPLQQGDTTVQRLIDAIHASPTWQGRIVKRK
jgi:hypothetical protein